MEFTVASPAVYNGIPPRHQHLWCLVRLVSIIILLLNQHTLVKSPPVQFVLQKYFLALAMSSHIRKFESKTEQAANAHKLTTPTTFAIMSESLSCLEAINSRSRSVTKRSSEIADLGVSKRQQRKTSPNKLWDKKVLEEED